MSASDTSLQCVLRDCTNTRHSRFLCNRHYKMARGRGVLGQLPMAWPYGNKASPPSEEAITLVSNLLESPVDAPEVSEAAPTRDEGVVDELRRKLDEVHLRASKATKDRGVMAKTIQGLRAELDEAQQHAASATQERDEAVARAQELDQRAAGHLDDLRDARADLSTAGMRVELLEAAQEGLRNRLRLVIVRRNTELLDQWAATRAHYDDLVELHDMTRAGLRELLGAVDMGRAVLTGVAVDEGVPSEAVLATVLDTLRELVEELIDSVELRGLPTMSQQPALLAVPPRPPAASRAAAITFVDETPPRDLDEDEQAQADADLLSLVGVFVSPADVLSWTDDQRAEAQAWAAAMHLHASDNEDVEVPDRPTWLPAEPAPDAEMLLPAEPATDAESAA